MVPLKVPCSCTARLGPRRAFSNYAQFLTGAFTGAAATDLVWLFVLADAGSSLKSYWRVSPYSIRMPSMMDVGPCDERVRTWCFFTLGALVTLSGITVCAVGVLAELAMLAAKAGVVSMVAASRTAAIFLVHSHFFLRGHWLLRSALTIMRVL